MKSNGHQPLVAPDAAPYRQYGIDKRERQSKNKGVMAGFDDHARPFGEHSALTLNTLNCVSSFARRASDSSRSCSRS